MAQHLIKPLLHHSISLTFQRDIHVLRKHRKNTIRTFSVEVFSMPTSAAPVNNLFEMEKITKIFKVIKTARLKGLSFNSIRPNLKCSSGVLAKRMLRVESLSIKDTSSTNTPLNLGIWLKKAKKIKKIDYLVQNLDKVILDKTDQRVRRLFVWLDRIKTKELSIDTNLCNYNPPFFFHKFPSSLKKLALLSTKTAFRKDHTPPLDYNNSLGNLTGLQALRLQTNVLNGVEVALLNTIPCLTELTALHLSLESLDNNIATYITPFLQKLSESTHLKRLQLDFSTFPKNLDPIFEALKSCSLIEFSFSGEPVSESHWDSLLTFISSLVKLKHFKLVLSLSWFRKTKFIDSQTTGELVEVLKKIISNSTELESFALGYPIPIESSHFEALIEALRTNSLSIKVLKIPTKKLQLFNSEFQKMMMGLRGFKKLEELDISGCVISGKACIEEIIDLCYKSKNLRALWLGEIRDIESKEIFAELVSQILCKRGLELFFCTFSNGLSMNYGLKREGKPYIDLNLIKQRNPFLEYPYLLENLFKYSRPGSSRPRAPTHNI